MTTEFDRDLEKYAEVIIKIGLNLQPGQRLLIGAPSIVGTDGTLLEAYPLVRRIAAQAYQAGAKYVAVNWDDEELQRIRVQYAAPDSMSEFAAWKMDVAVEYVDNGDAFLRLAGMNPDLMNGLDARKVEAKRKTTIEQSQRLTSKVAAGATNWLIAAAATASWAAKVFPDLPQDEAKARLWQAILETSRIKQDDPIAGWKRHVAELGKRAAYLNGKQYTALKYRSPGTDLTVGLPRGHIWSSADMTAQNGITGVVNIPTEEVFTMPHKDQIDGVVAATMPLSYAGNLIENFTLKFSEGQVVHATAQSGQGALDNLLNTDTASRSLGEVALVPHSSPISKSGILFYSTLFDENASSHLALGNAYRSTMKGGVGMTAEEFASAGGNTSKTHVDFMIGSAEMDVDGITAEGAAEPVMRNGEWVIKV